MREQVVITGDVNGWPPASESHPTWTSAQEANDYYSSVAPLPTSSFYPDVPSMSNGDFALPNEVTIATDWLSFFLMTVGWLLFLTSLLGYWRVKRWERSLRSTPAQINEFSGAYASTVRGGMSRDFRRLFTRLTVEDERTQPEVTAQLVRPTHPEPPMDPETRRRYEHALQIDRQ